jgi:hypothetical protein
LAILDQTAIGKMPNELALERRLTPKAFGAVLPLHHGVNGFAILGSQFSTQAQCSKFTSDSPGGATCRQNRG